MNEECLCTLLPQSARNYKPEQKKNTILKQDHLKSIVTCDVINFPPLHTHTSNKVPEMKPVIIKIFHRANCKEFAKVDVDVTKFVFHENFMKERNFETRKTWIYRHQKSFFILANFFICTFLFKAKKIICLIDNFFLFNVLSIYLLFERKRERESFVSLSCVLPSSGPFPECKLLFFANVSS